MGYVSCAITALLICALCWLYKVIKGIVGCVEASCDAIWAMPFILPVPILDVGLKIIWTLIWLVLFAWCITSGEVTVPEATFGSEHVHGFIRQFGFNTMDKIRIGYYILALVW